MNALPRSLVSTQTDEEFYARWPRSPASWEAMEVGKRYSFEEQGRWTADICIQCHICGRREFRRDGGMMHTCFGPSGAIEEVDVCKEKCYAALLKRLRENASGKALVIDVPAMYVDAKIEDFHGMDFPVKDRLSAKARGILQDWPRKEKMIFIQAAPGRGKTRMCWAVALACAQRGVRVQVENALSLRTRWFIASTRDKVEEAMMRSRWLIIDEFASADMRFGWSEFVLRLLSYRSEHELATIVSAKETLQSALQCFEPASAPSIVSRLQTFKSVVLLGPDRREGAK